MSGWFQLATRHSPLTTYFPTTRHPPLPTDPRLPGPGAARLAHPQATRDAAGTGGTAAGRTLGLVELEARQPHVADVDRVHGHPLVDLAFTLVRTAAADDVACRPRPFCPLWWPLRLRVCHCVRCSANCLSPSSGTGQGGDRCRSEQPRSGRAGSLARVEESAPADDHR